MSWTHGAKVVVNIKLYNMTFSCHCIDFHGSSGSWSVLTNDGMLLWCELPSKRWFNTSRVETRPQAPEVQQAPGWEVDTKQEDADRSLGVHDFQACFKLHNAGVCSFFSCPVRRCFVAHVTPVVLCGSRDIGSARRRVD